MNIIRFLTISLFLLNFQCASAHASQLQSVSAGSDHFIALRVDGTVFAWGNNEQGECTIPVSVQSQVTAASAGRRYSLVLKNGGVTAWGDNTSGLYPVPAEALTGVSAISAGGTFALALKNGAVIAWGEDSFGQINVPVAARSGVVAISAGYAHALALKGDGSVVAWGANFSSQAEVPAAAMSDVRAIAAGAVHSLALKNDGSLVAWGDASLSATDIPLSASSGVTAIAAGGNFSIALKGSSVILWGDSAAISIPNDWGTATAIAAGGTIASAVVGNGYASSWGSPGLNSKVLVTLAFAGNGAGNVNSNPAGLNCTSGPCQGAFDSGTSILLAASPSTGFHFTGWQQFANCSGTGDCTWTLTGNAAVAAGFDRDPSRARVLQSGTLYPLIMQAYAAALNGNTIQIVKDVSVESLVIDENKQIGLKGGYEQAFDVCTSRSYLSGTLNIKQGKLIVDRIVIKGH